MFKDAPNDYRAPFWSNLASIMERKHGLPSGLLVGIIQKGERSNANAVSEAGARTPFQIIPETRAAIEKKYGIDPYLSPKTAAEGAALLLKESLERNKGDVKTAVAEYHGGTNRANWGPRTTAYVARVTGGAAPQRERMTLEGRRAERGTQAAAKPDLGARITRALSGADGPEARAKMIADLRDAKVIAPRGVALPPEVTAPRQVTAEEVAAYESGAMDAAARADLALAVEGGYAALPAGATLSEPQKPGLIAGLVEAVTGNKRATAETRALPDWASMPELNQLSMASAKTGLGTLMTSPDETVQVIQANFPGVQVRRDANGNAILRSSIDGQEYALKPGFQPSDIPRTVGAIAAFTPAGAARTVGGAALASGATQAAIETTQAATGGEFNPGEVVTATALGGAVPLAGRIVQAAKPGVVNAVQRIDQALPGGVARQEARTAAAVAAQAVPDRLPPVAAVAPETAPPAPEMPPVAAVAPEAPVPPAGAPVAAAADEMLPEQLAALAREASKGKAGATQSLAAIVKVNPEAEAAARALGVDLPVDILSDNAQFVGTAALARARIGGPEQAAWFQTLTDSADKFDDLLARMDGATDAASLSDKVLTRLKSDIDGLEKQANKLRDQVDEAIPPDSTARAPIATRNLMDETVRDLGGANALTPQERKLLEMVNSDDPVTYARLVRERQEIGRALGNKGGVYADVSTALLKRLYGALADDQLAHVERVGGKTLADTMRASNTIYSKMFRAREAAVARFGKDLDGSIARQLVTAIEGGARGDIKPLRQMLADVPEDMRKEVLATSLMTAVRAKGGGSMAGRFGFSEFMKTWRGIKRNQPVYALFRETLGPDAVATLDNMGTIAARITNAREAASIMKTGAGLQTFVNEMKAQGLLAKIMGSAVSRVAVTGAAGVTGGPLGAGLAAAVSETVARAPKDATRAVSQLLDSPEFKDMAVKAATAPDVPPSLTRKVANSAAFSRYMRTINGPRAMTAKEQWLLQAMQAENQFDAATQVPEQR
jgi:hypothetical protein